MHRHDKGPPSSDVSKFRSSPRKSGWMKAGRARPPLVGPVRHYHFHVQGSRGMAFRSAEPGVRIRAQTARRAGDCSTSCGARRLGGEMASAQMFC